MRALTLMMMLVILGGWTDTRGQIRIESASAGKPYDFVVHLRNVPDIGYNPVVDSDRRHMALKLLRQQCRAARVVGEDTIKTEIWGLTSSPPDYVVLVRCG